MTSYRVIYPRCGKEHWINESDGQTIDVVSCQINDCGCAFLIKSNSATVDVTKEFNKLYTLT